MRVTFVCSFQVRINRSGLILSADKKFLVIFGSEAVLDNDVIFRFVSSLKLPHEQNEEVFGLSLSLSHWLGPDSAPGKVHRDANYVD